MIRLWGRSTSTNVQKVLWFTEELKLDIEHREVGGPFGGLDTPEFARLNPNRTVPVLEYDGCVIWESHAILRFLANKNGAESYYPGNANERSYDDRWLDWHSNVFWPPIRTLFLDGWRDKVFALNSPEASKLFARVAANVDLLETCRVGEAESSGDARLSDLPLVIGLNRLLTVNPEFTLPPHVADWFARLTSRPGFSVVRDAERNLRI
ncbi:glutathione S-transferase family protein [uncultured Tateyamaria sp.]|uniref:glutathione S-transferase family protein n=1 Tax=uncultured Tateyamaria sp. TaxID=455651 RepID=UPI00260BB6C6|nr:glutathione S-transferase N-terminal domain-containing protein [uncultured Tateyamaria sp.]